MIKILIWVTLIIAGIFGILSAEYTTLGWVAFGCGLFSGLLSNLQNQVENKTIRDLLDAQNTINFKTGGSNLYLQTFFNELSKKKISKYDDKLLKKAIETSPKDNNALLTWLSIEILRIEQKKFFSGVYDKDRILKVKTLLNQIPQISEYESNLLLLKGMLYDINGDQENAQKYFRELSVKYPNSFWEAPLSLSLMKSNKYQEAINILEDQIKNKKGNYITFFYLGRAFSELGEWDKALSNFKFSFRLRGSNPELLFSLATAYLYSNKKFHFIYYRLKLAIKLLLLKDYSVAFNMLFKTILLLFFYLYFSFEEIICKITIGIPLLNKVTIKLFSPIKFYRATGNELFFYRRHYKFALKFYECYLKIDEKCSEFYDLIAQCYAMLGETKKAVEKINVALKFDPLNILYLSHKKVIETGKTPTIKTSVNLEITKQLAQKQFYKKN